MKFEILKISPSDIEQIKLCDAAEKLIVSFTNAGKTVAGAESCTGGLFGATLTQVSGASLVYCGGVISYTNDVKESVLGVRRTTLEAYSAVSEYTACEMARGVREKLCADFGVSVTGYAGPLGGDDKNPVGTVFVCIADASGEKVTRLCFEPLADREQIRRYAVYFMITELTKMILK